MIIKTPPMGWNSWNTFGHDINEKLIFEIADIMASEGYLDAGYEYLVIDDCWQEMVRGRDGRLVPDRKKFPNGMKAVADYVHSKGLKLGIYSCAGQLTCEGFPGSYEHEFIDAETFAEWGVDFLKYDYCFKPKGADPACLYRRMGMALANCGRDILFSGCSWGADETRKWMKTTGAHMWRCTGDMVDSAVSIKDHAYNVDRDLKYSAMGSYADFDMMVVGMYDNGNVSAGGATTAAYKSHFTFWSHLGSPLMIGADLRNISKECKDILLNRDVIAINQDPAFWQPYEIGQIGSWNPKGNPVYCKLLGSGELAIGYYNFYDEEANLSTPLDRIGLNMSTGKTLEMTEVWTGEKELVHNGVHSTKIAAWDCKLYRCKVVDLQYGDM
ncbi:MAG: glycoside hydrolase family 27 protein [Ruminococcaceae bacterium]|nr:glycoside hydrolase family 27 protein [Oscillospiraceae bacterium]